MDALRRNYYSKEWDPSLLSVRGQSRVLLSKSDEPISTRGSISVCITFPSFLASPVCIM